MVLEIFSTYPDHLKKIFISNALRDKQFDDAGCKNNLTFVIELLGNNPSLLLEIISDCDDDIKKIIAFYAMNNPSDQLFLNLLKDLLKAEKINDSIICQNYKQIKDKLFFIKSLKEILTEIKEITSLIDYLILSKNYEILEDIISKNYEILEDIIEMPNGLFDEEIDSPSLTQLFEDLLKTEYDIKFSAFLIKKINPQPIELSNENIIKFICYFVETDDVDGLEMMLKIKKISIHDIVKEEFSLMNYAIEKLSIKIIPYLKSQLRDGEMSIEKPQEESEFYKLLKLKKEQFDKITEQEINDLIDSLTPLDKEINLSDLFNKLTHEEDIQNAIHNLRTFISKLEGRDLSQVEEINFRGCKIPITFIMLIMDKPNLKKIFSQLKKLNLEDSSFLKTGCTKEDFSKIQDFFKIINRNIEDLKISHNDEVTIENIKKLITQLRTCKKLKKLDIYFERPIDPGGKIDFSVLLDTIRNPDLIELNIQVDNQVISDEVCDKLEKNHILQIFKFNCSNKYFITKDRILNKFVNALKFNYTLRDLDLGEFNDPKITALLQRNQKIFYKSQELYGEDKGVILGQRLKNLQLILTENIGDDSKLKIQSIMDIFIKELMLLPTKQINVNEVMDKILAINLELFLNDSQVENIKKSFDRFIEVDRKRKKMEQAFSGNLNPRSSKVRKIDPNASPLVFKFKMSELRLKKPLKGFESSFKDPGRSPLILKFRLSELGLDSPLKGLRSSSKEGRT